MAAAKIFQVVFVAAITLSSVCAQSDYGYSGYDAGSDSYRGGSGSNIGYTHNADTVGLHIRNKEVRGQVVVDLDNDDGSSTSRRTTVTPNRGQGSTQYYPSSQAPQYNPNSQAPQYNQNAQAPQYNQNAQVPQYTPPATDDSQSSHTRTNDYEAKIAEARERGNQKVAAAHRKVELIGVKTKISQLQRDLAEATRTLEDLSH